MNKYTSAAIAVTGTVVVGASIVQSIMTHRRESAKRNQIENDLQFDLEAIRRAGQVIRDRINSEDGFVPFHVWSERFEDEMAFQKIVVREQ